MRKVLSNNARPSFFVDANRDLAFAARHHDWPLDDAGVGQHQDACAGGIAHLGLPLRLTRVSQLTWLSQWSSAVGSTPSFLKS